MFACVTSRPFVTVPPLGVGVGVGVGLGESVGVGEAEGDEDGLALGDTEGDGLPPDVLGVGVADSELTTRCANLMHVSPHVRSAELVAAARIS